MTVLAQGHHSWQAWKGENWEWTPASIPNHLGALGWAFQFQPKGKPQFFCLKIGKNPILPDSLYLSGVGGSGSQETSERQRLLPPAARLGLLFALKPEKMGRTLNMGPKTAGRIIRQATGSSRHFSTPPRTVSPLPGLGLLVILQGPVWTSPPQRVHPTPDQEPGAPHSAISPHINALRTTPGM